MRLKSKITLAQLPLVAIFVLVSVIFVVTSLYLAKNSQYILSSNFASIVSTQKMHQSLGYIDQAIILTLEKRKKEANKRFQMHKQQFENQLDEQFKNITIYGEQEATELLKSEWDDFKIFMEAFIRDFDSIERNEKEIELLKNKIQAVKEAIVTIETLNHDAMRNKGAQVSSIANEAAKIMVMFSIAAFGLGIIITTWLTTRIMKPLTIFTSLVRSVGEGQLEHRIDITGDDEVAELGREFNDMISKLREYRTSSVGELVKVKTFLQATIDAIPDPVFILNVSDGKIIGFNKTATQISTKKNIISIDVLYEVLPQAIKDRIAELYFHVKNSKEETLPKYLKKIITVDIKHHKVQFVPVVKVVTDDLDEVSSIIVILRNITDIDIHGYVKTDIITSMINWFLPPLNLIQTSIHACIEHVVGDINQKQTEFLFIAREECIRIRKIIRDFNELDKLEEASVYLGKREKLELQPLINNIVKSYVISQGDKKIIKDIPPILSNVLADAIQIATVVKVLIENAIDNAVDVSDITIKVEEKEQQIFVSVHNFGKPIPLEYQTDIFEKFFKLPGDTSDNEGLGLYIAKKIITSHDGRMWVESNKKEGTTFSFSLPIEKD